MQKKLQSLLAFGFLYLNTININAQNIYTFAGNGSSGYVGDGGNAKDAELFIPFGVAADGLGNVYIGEYGNHCVRKVNPSGTITTFAGTGVIGYSGDGNMAVNAQLSMATGVAIDLSGNVYIVDQGNSRIRKVNTLGIISTFCGTGIGGYSGDGGPATNAQLDLPTGIAIDISGNMYIIDGLNQRVRKVNTSGIISTFAGTGISGYSGDGGAAIFAQFADPNGVAVDGFGNVYISDGNNQVIRKVNPAGIMSTFAGNNISGIDSDGIPATAAKLFNPSGVAVDGSGNVYVADQSHHRIRKINTAGIISTYAGTGTNGFSGDGGIATNAIFFGPQALCLDAMGNMYVGDGNRVREICVGGCLAGIDQFDKSRNEIFASPNPNNGSFKIRIESDIENGELVLINSMGKRVYEQKLTTGENNIITNEISKGLYSYIIMQNKQQVFVSKLMIE